jgi:hypothetical protein
MSNRAARRAAAHQSSKNVSEAQLAANRANCQSSTGPKSEQGKLVSSHNALKTGLTGRTIVLPTDDVAAYQTLVALINRKFNPANDIEQHLTQTIADTEWRLLRIPTLESGFYALGRHELAADCAHEPDPQLRATMLEAHIFRTYQKDLRNLALQERRLRNQLKQDTAELRRLQQERLEQDTATEPRASASATAGKPKNGFEFSTPPTPAVHEPVPTPDTTQPDQINLKTAASAAMVMKIPQFRTAADRAATARSANDLANF